ncbi:DDE-type integrase/transposase/recombinase [Streptomyces sp. NPDC087659]|uniref:DDE-type integrase/transposase/recombinase n=1 Tax=Streptomyces sp. NPDC087659 TaxID=3365801 RepID=UPI0037FB668F
MPEPSATPVPDLFTRDFTAPEANLKYMGDVTYLPVGDGEFLYLATVIDCFSRRVVVDRRSHAHHPGRRCMTMAAATRGSLAGAIFPSDHGAQYVSRRYADTCAELGVPQSMGAVGMSADNAACESFHISLKQEILKGARRFAGADIDRRTVFRWPARSNTWRRHERRSSTLAVAA